MQFSLIELDITPERLAAYAQELVSVVKLEWLVYGNMTETVIIAEFHLSDRKSVKLRRFRINWLVF